MTSPFAWRGPSHIADADPSMRHKPPHKRITPINQIVLNNKYNTINTVTTLARDKTHKLLRGSILFHSLTFSALGPATR